MDNNIFDKPYSIKKLKVNEIERLISDLQVPLHELKLIEEEENIILDKVKEICELISPKISYKYKGVFPENFIGFSDRNALRMKMNIVVYETFLKIREDRYNDIIKIYENGSKTSNTD